MRVMKIGLISDTHGRLHASVCGYFCGAELILHAGDIGSSVVLEELAKVAPVIAVVGNMDGHPLSDSYPAWRIVEAEGLTILLVHRPPSMREVQEMAQKGGVKAVDVVVHGHTHVRRLEKRHGILFVNPGAAGGSGATFSTAVLTLEPHASPQVEFFELHAE
jgi:putative phosphoesterase